MTDPARKTASVDEDEFPMPVLEKLLEACLDAQDVKGIGAVLHAMAVRDPKRAEELRQAMLLGCRMASASDGDKRE